MTKEDIPAFIAHAWAIAPGVIIVLTLLFILNRLGKIARILEEIRDDPERPSHQQLEEAKATLRAIRDNSRDAEAQRLFEKTTEKAGGKSAPKSIVYDLTPPNQTPRP